MSTFSSLSALQKFLAVVLSIVMIGTIVYYAWPILLILIGASEVVDSGKYYTTDHRMKREQGRGIIFTNTDCLL